MDEAAKAQERPASAKRTRLQEAIELDTSITVREIREEEVKRTSSNLIGIIVKSSSDAYARKIMSLKEPPT